MIRRCLPSTPTMTEPFGWNDTTDGWIFTPAGSASTLGAPFASQAATTELVVPRSMPTIGSATGQPAPALGAGKDASTPSYHRSSARRKGHIHPYAGPTN